VDLYAFILSQYLICDSIYRLDLNQYHQVLTPESSMYNGITELNKKEIEEISEIIKNKGIFVMISNSNSASTKGCILQGKWA